MIKLKTGWVGMLAVMLVAMVMAFSSVVFAGALTEGRDTAEWAGDSVVLIQGSNTIYVGAIVAVDTNGLAVAASDSAGHKVFGRCEVTKDNTGADYSATAMVVAKRGIFRWENGGSFTYADIGKTAYVEDDQTVTTAALATNDIAVGMIVGVDAAGIWVDTRLAPAL